MRENVKYAWMNSYEMCICYQCCCKISHADRVERASCYLLYVSCGDCFLNQTGDRHRSVVPVRGYTDCFMHVSAHRPHFEVMYGNNRIHYITPVIVIYSAFSAHVRDLLHKHDIINNQHFNIVTVRRHCWILNCNDSDIAFYSVKSQLIRTLEGAACFIE